MCYAKLQQTNVEVFFLIYLFFFLEKIKLDISHECFNQVLFFFLKNKKLNTLTLPELYFIFPGLERGFSA